MTAALEGGEWSAVRPGRTLPPGKTRYPFYKRLGVPQGRSGRVENLVPTRIRSRTVQPVVSRYTDWATRPTINFLDCGDDDDDDDDDDGDDDDDNNNNNNKFKIASNKRDATVMGSFRLIFTQDVAAKTRVKLWI